MVKLPDKNSLEGFTKKITEAVKLPNEAENPKAAENNTGLTEKDLEKIREEERKKIEQEQKNKEAAEKAKKYEEIEAQKLAEEKRLLEEKKKQIEIERLEKERMAEEAQKQRERESWAREEDKKKLEEDKKRAEIEKELLRKQKEEQKAAAGKQSHTLRNILIVVVIILAVIAAGYVSLITGNDNINAYGYPLSYSATYDILIPDNTDINFAGIPVKAISSGDSVTLMINNDRRTLSMGQSATFPAKHLTVKTLGITVFDGDYEVTATYLGVVTNRDDFRTIVKTSQPIPSWLVNLMTPSGVQMIAV